jgi:cyclophilin family peptidyl-prolyl cis-trans isomerase
MAGALLLMSVCLRVLKSMGAASLFVLLIIGCRSEGGSATAQEQGVVTDVAPDGDALDGPASWGPAVPMTVTPQALAAELSRRPGDGLRSIADGKRSGELRARGFWSFARIDNAEARTWLLADLDGEGSSALAAAALLEVPRSEPGSPPEPLDGAPEWATLEDALWTRYALTDPAALGQAQALLLSIARVGGSRTIARLGVDLTEVPGPDHAAEHVGRWVAAMQALGIACARGWSLDQLTLDAVLAGLQQRPGVDPAISSASLFAVSRCARSSGELLVESRERIVERLSTHVENPPSPMHASLAWRTFAALGELPASIPSEILGAQPPGWDVEVEAVRALGSDADGAELLRERLAQTLEDQAGEALAGPRVHVVIAALHAMRSVIDIAPPTADAQLLTIAQRLTEVRRSEDPRARKAAALALCELRLLQAIRNGETQGLERCHVLAGAPAVELPTSVLVNFEVEALLRATRDDAARNGKLRTVAMDDEAVLADRVEDETPDEPGRALRIARLLELARDGDPARATTALHALSEIDDPSVLPTLRVALLSEDPGILAAAATTIAVRSVDASKRDPDAVELLEVLVEQRTKAGELEARLSAIEALGALARTAVASVDPTPTAAPTVDPEAPWLARTILPLATDVHVAVRRRAREALLGRPQLLLAFDAAELDAADQDRPSPFPESLSAALDEFLEEPVAGLRVTTSAGIFTIEFAGVASPINQANLVSLARSGFYAGLSFHRVVPGFVVQGGDPRGDGYGGPGYVVPCEWSNLRYERGTVGIALAGKDTGGSQFFVTQTPQPHLDARYTVVGQVGEGLEVIDRLLPGDVIEAVEVVYSLAPAGAP